VRKARALVVLAALALALPAAAAGQVNPVIAGNVADPSVVRAEGRYWAAATSGQWAPVFPLFVSRDLVNWRQTGAVFRRPPSWARGKFWAPALTHHRGTWSVYYSASRLPERPCIAVAQAPSPRGPWRDRGFVACPPSGAIDAAAVSVPGEGRFLLWKRMGWGHGIYGARLSRNGRDLTSRARRLVEPDARWERGVTEGPDVVRQGGGYVLVYSGGNCCTPPCTYSVGVARAPHPLGPYTKYPGNPVLRPGNGWKCPGHGTLVEPPGGGLAFLHHAYRDDDPFNVHRQALLDPVTFADDGWPVFGEGGVPVAPAAGDRDALSFEDEFAGHRLQPGWEWPFDARPRVTVGGGVLRVHDGMVTRSWVPRRYAAFARLRGDGLFGLLLTDGRLVGLRVSRSRLLLLDGQRVAARASRAARARGLTVRLDVRDGGRTIDAYVREAGRWRRVGAPLAAPKGVAVDRIALGRGAFEALRLRPLAGG
jgi:beta-xylosidase